MTTLPRYKSFFVAGSIFLVCLQIAVVILGFSGGLQGRADFRMFFAGGILVRTGHGNQLYNYEKIASTEKALVGNAGVNFPFAHPAFEALLFSALTTFSYRQAYCLFFAINLGLLAACFCLLAPAAAWLREIWPPLPVLVVAGFLPVAICLIVGQDSILLFTLISVAYIALKRDRELVAGFVLGFGMFRFPIVLPLVLFFCQARRWKPLAAFVATSIAVLLLCVLVAGPGFVSTYPQLLLHQPGAPESVEFGIQSNSMPNLRGLIEFALGKWFSALTVRIVVVVSSLVLMAWAVIRRLPFELWVVVALLVSYHELIHDSVLLLLPLLTLRQHGPGRLLLWSLVLASPTLAFLVFRAPLTLLAVVYLILLQIMAKPPQLFPRSGRQLHFTTP